MIIGSGLLGKGFSAKYYKSNDVCIYAAGVSNSRGSDKAEFEREKLRLNDALLLARDLGAFVYFGTCSVLDPETRYTEYTQHKLAMEQLVSTHPNYLILRLPQVAGRSSNPYTLLNFIFERIKRNEMFSVWKNAYRNIIDIDDVVTIGSLFIDNQKFRQCIVNLANPENYGMPYIIEEMERVVGKLAVCKFVNRGQNYCIDVTLMRSLTVNLQLIFGENYLNRILNKYYGKI